MKKDPYVIELGLQVAVECHGTDEKRGQDCQVDLPTSPEPLQSKVVYNNSHVQSDVLFQKFWKYKGSVQIVKLPLTLRNKRRLPYDCFL